MPNILTIIASLLLAGIASAQEHLSFPTQDGWLIYADLYQGGDRGVVLVHGGRLTKESWGKQARQLVEAGCRVLAIDLRGFGQSKRASQRQPPDDGQQLDVLAAVRYLRKTGSKMVSVVGGSMGGVAAAETRRPNRHKLRTHSGSQTSHSISPLSTHHSKGKCGAS